MRAMNIVTKHTLGLLWKRQLDIALAIFLLFYTFPILCVAATATWLMSPGPILFCQQREGFGGHPFKLWKLRTMYLNADELLQKHLEENPEVCSEWQTYCRLTKDPRILPAIGHFNRRFSIDELPQLWNVIRGDMSLVGPRPFPLEHLGLLHPRYRQIRLTVKPGLTGLWQVSGRSEHDIRKQQALDTLYVRKWTFSLDLWILLKTLPAVISARGAY
jgi:lipopolysaccharide/colanic/teichoic acid biosynthesis glycosyltransferase